MAHNLPKTSVPLPTSTQDYNKLITGSLTEYIKRQVLKSEYEELIEKYQNKTELWVD